MEQYIDISEQAFAEQIQKINDVWRKSEPGSGEELAACITEKILGYVDDELAKTWDEVVVNDVINMLIPALNEIRCKIISENQQ